MEHADRTRAWQRAAQIAAGLDGGGRWLAALGDSRADAQLRGPDDVALTLVEHGDDRVSVSWTVPATLRRHVSDQIEHHHEISMSAHKSAETMAREITRRLLPNVHASLAAIHRRKSAIETAETHRQTLIEQLRAALNITPTEQDRHGNLQLGQFGTAVYGTVEITDGDRDVVFSLVVGHTLALAVATAIGNALQPPDDDHSAPPDPP